MSWLLLIVPALAWGPEGHHAIAEAAEARLSPEALEALRQLDALPLADLSTLPDAWRDEARHRWTAPLHYLNVDPAADRIDLARDCPDHRCAPSALAHHAHRLGPGGEPEARRTAVAWVVHLVGDLHQPLHVAYAHDKGGNLHTVRLDGRELSLHRLWDGPLAQQAVASGLPTVAGGGTPIGWAEESFQLARTRVYLPPGAEVDAGALAASTALAGERLALAGARLAEVLDAGLLGEPLPFADPVPPGTSLRPRLEVDLSWVRGGAALLLALGLLGAAVGRLRQPERDRAARRLLEELLRHPVLLAGSVASVVATSAVDVAVPLAYAYALEVVVGDFGVRTVGTLVVGALGLVAVSGLAWVGSAASLSRLAAGVQHDLRLRMLDRLQGARLTTLRDLGTADVLARFSADLHHLDTFLLRELGKGLRSVLQLLGLFVLLVVVEWRLTLGVLLLLPLASRVPRIYARQIAAAMAERRTREDLAAELVVEQLHTLPTLRAYGLEGRWRGRYEARSAALAEQARNVGWLSVMTPGLSNVTILFVTMAVCVLAAAMAGMGWVSLGGLAVVCTALYQLAAAAGRMGTAVPATTQVLDAVARVDALLALPQQGEGPSDDGASLPLRRGLVLEDVGVVYPGGRHALEGVRCTLAAGTSVAVVGPSGAGKSTLLDLVMGYLAPSEGRLVWDDVPLRSLSPAAVRASIGYVPQEAALFADTLRENIRLGRPGASDAEVEHAARRAHVHHDIVARPLGYDTRVGPGGERLSGGEAQRIAIARALIRRPALLVLDEPTSALDPSTAAAFRDTLEAVRTETTTLLVTHDLTSVRTMDRILVLERGRLVGDGPHEDLMARCPTYRRLVEHQQGFRDAEGGFRLTAEGLRQTASFAEMPEAALDALAARGRQEDFASGSVVVQQGDPGDRMYLIARGRLALSVADPGGREVFARTLEVGDCAGEIALLQGGPRTGTLTAVGHTSLMSVHRADFEAVMAEVPVAAQWFEMQAAKRLVEQRMQASRRAP